MSTRRIIGTAFITLAMAAALILPAANPTIAAGPTRVVVLPFTANAKEDISFVAKGIRDMLASRLPWKDKVVVVEPDLVAPVLKQIKPPYNDAKARQVGKELSAQVVVFGTITMLGKSVSVDARVVKVGEDKPALTTYVQAKDLDDVIPQINAFAQRINAEIFRRPEAIAAREAATKPQTPPAKGESGMEDLPANISPLNPLFLKRLSGVESDRYWRSPRLNGVVSSLAVSDIDGDGKNELVVLMGRSVRFYRLEKDHFSLIYNLKNGPRGDYLFVDCVDMDGNGRPEIFVTSHINQSVNSFVLEWQADRPIYKIKEIGYYFRVQPNPLNMKEKWLFGQKTAINSPFYGPVYKLKAKGGTYVPEKELDLPKMADINNFVMADLNNAGKIMYVVVGPTYHLRVFNHRKQQLWMSGELYNVSNKFIEFMQNAGTDYEESWWYLYTRLLLADLNNDGRQEIICQQSKGRFGLALEKTMMIYQATIYSMSWNGMSMEEDWRTPRINGALTDYNLGDVGNVGRPALVMGVSQKIFDGFFDKGVSNVIAFTLKPQSVKKRANKGL